MKKESNKVIVCYEKHYIILSSYNARTSCECTTTSKLSDQRLFSLEGHDQETAAARIPTITLKNPRFPDRLQEDMVSMARLALKSFQDV